MAGAGTARTRFDLERKVEDAHTVPAERAPSDLVTMNSTVVLLDLDSRESRVCTLVYPGDRDLIPNSVGVLQQLGQSILGRRIGDVIQLREGGRTRRLRVQSIAYQPS
jgi:regulator of nucleoside diphosphate kinase